MALRPIDNALPAITAPERPKKQAKIAVPVKKQQSVAGVNDENVAPLPPPPASAEASIDYISSDKLEPIPDPEFQIQSLFEGLESKDWLKQCDSINKARQFAIHHSSLLRPILEKIIAVLMKAMKSPRSALIKTSIMASSDLFKAFGDQLLLLHESTNSPPFDNMLLQLLLKASQDKKFVCEEAERSLKIMVESMTPLPLLLLRKLTAYVSHSNPRIRARAAISISHCVSNMELEGMKEFGLVPLIRVAINSLNDRLPEAREAARSTVISIYRRAFEEEEKEDKEKEGWESFCNSNLPPIHAQAILKLVSSH